MACICNTSQDRKCPVHDAQESLDQQYKSWEQVSAGAADSHAAQREADYQSSGNPGALIDGVAGTLKASEEGQG